MIFWFIFGSFYGQRATNRWNCFTFLQISFHTNCCWSSNKNTGWQNIRCNLYRNRLVISPISRIQSVAHKKGICSDHRAAVPNLWIIIALMLLNQQPNNNQTSSKQMHSACLNLFCLSSLICTWTDTRRSKHGKQLHKAQENYGKSKNSDNTPQTIRVLSIFLTKVSNPKKKIGAAVTENDV